MAKPRITKTKHVKRVMKPAGAKAKAKKPKTGQPDTYLSWIDAYSPEHAYLPEPLPEAM